MLNVQPTQWVISRNFDLVFFLCPVVLGLLYFLSLTLAPAHAFLITAIVWVVFAQTHFGSTWFIYFDKKNREHYAKHALVYYVMPALIMAVSLVVGYYAQTVIVIVVAVASLYHVAKQNTGILQLYRMRNNEREPEVRTTENFTVYAWSLFFGSFGALKLPYIADLVGPILPAAHAGIGVLFLIAVGGTLRVIVQYVKRPQNSLPKTVFLIISILMYSPYVYASAILLDIYQMEIATLTSLIAHYVQYIGIVWLININKYAGETTFAKENGLLHQVSSNYLYIVGAIVAYAVGMAGLRWGVTNQSTVMFRVLPNIVMGLMIIHFYIDSFIWRFRDPFVRETVLPFIKPVSLETAK